ncbi:MAG: PilZ domain-containing protein [Rhodovulum sp.]
MVLLAASTARADCALESWLAETYRKGTALSRAETGAAVLSIAPALIRHLAKRDPDAVATAMRRAGFAADITTVRTYIEAQTQRLANLSDGRLDSLPMGDVRGSAMGTFIARLDCPIAEVTSTGYANLSTPDGWTSQAGASLARRPTAATLTAIGLLSGALALAGGRLVGRYARRAVRERCAIRATLRLEDTTYDGLATNISRLGAKLTLPCKQARRGHGTLNIAGRDIPCRVIWSESGTVGLAFRRRLGATALREMLTYHQCEIATDAVFGNEERRPMGAVTNSG